MSRRSILLILAAVLAGCGVEFRRRFGRLPDLTSTAD
jgi:hypothetical protein